MPIATTEAIVDHEVSEICQGITGIAAYCTAVKLKRLA
jgi:hypothetical protein